MRRLTAIKRVNAAAVEKYLPDNAALSSTGKTYYLYITGYKDTTGMVFEMCSQNT